MDLKLALTSADELPQASEKSAKPRAPSLLKGAGRAALLRVGPIATFAVYVAAVTSVIMVPAKKWIDAQGLAMQGECAARRNSTHVAHDLFDNSEGVLLLVRDHHCGCSEDLPSRFNINNMTEGMLTGNHTVVLMSISHVAANISRIEVDHLPNGSNLTRVRLDSLNTSSDRERLNWFLDKKLPVGVDHCISNYSQVATLIVVNQSSAACESVIDAKQILKWLGVITVFDTLLVRPARVALLLAFNGQLSNRTSTAIRAVLMRTLRQVKIDLAYFFFGFFLFLWYGARAVIVDWSLANIIVVVEPELVTIQSVFTRSKALIRDSRCSSTAVVLTWWVMNFALSVACQYWSIDLSVGLLKITYALQAANLIFFFSLWQKLARCA